MIPDFVLNEAEQLQMIYDTAVTQFFKSKKGMTNRTGNKLKVWQGSVNKQPLQPDWFF